MEIQPSRLPGWLLPAKQDHSNFYTEATWNELIVRVSNGEPLPKILSEPHLPTLGQLNLFLRKNPERLEEINLAKKVYARTVLEEEIIEIADGEFNLASTDTQRAKLMIDTRMKVMVANDGDRYGKTNNDAGVVNINISDAMERGRERAERVINVVPE